MNQQIVNLRGIAILLVIIGHSIIIYDTGFELLTSEVRMPIFETLKHWISFVQMKLFISISGFLLAYKCSKYDEISEWRVGQFVRNKIQRLLIPYFCILILYNNPIKYILNIPGYENIPSFLTDQLLGVNCAHLWYLPCLFLLMLVCYPLFRLAGKSLLAHSFLLAIFLGVNYFSGTLPEFFQLNNFGYYLIFFHVGYLINFARLVYIDENLLIKKKSIQLVIISGVVILAFAINRVTSIGFEVYLSVVILISLYKFVPCFNNCFINEVSKRSYGLYLFHSPLIYITAILCPNINPWLMLFVNFIVFGSIAYFITIVLSRSKFKYIVGE